MHRRPVGRARLLGALGAIVILVGCVLPWWAIGGGDVLPARSGNAFDGMGVVVFIVALATIALVTLPYAMGRPVGGDRWPAYAILALLGWAALGIRVLDLIGLRALAFAQVTDAFTRGPGLWITGVGLAMLARAAFDLYREPSIR